MDNGSGYDVNDMIFYQTVLEHKKPIITSCTAIIVAGLLSIGIIEGFRKS